MQAGDASQILMIPADYTSREREEPIFQQIVPGVRHILCRIFCWLSMILSYFDFFGLVSSFRFIQLSPYNNKGVLQWQKVIPSRNLS